MNCREETGAIGVSLRSTVNIDGWRIFFSRLQCRNRDIRISLFKLIVLWTLVLVSVALTTPFIIREWKKMEERRVHNEKLERFREAMELAELKLRKYFKDR